jgi:hypothetical protein
MTIIKCNISNKDVTITPFFIMIQLNGHFAEGFSHRILSAISSNTICKTTDKHSLYHAKKL